MQTLPTLASLPLLLLAGCGAFAQPVDAVGEPQSLNESAPGAVALEPQRISVDGLIDALADGDAVVLDTRDELQWLVARIPGALHLPIGAVESLVQELPEDKLLVTYCSCPAEETSLVVADQLMALGFPRVGVLIGGFELWQEMGEPVESQ